MKVSSNGFAALSATILAASLVSAAPASGKSSSGQGIRWHGRIFQDDPKEYTFRGDISEVYAQILAVNPEYKAEHFHNATTAAHDQAKRAIRKRNKSTLLCQNFSTADLFDASSDIGLLNTVGGSCSVDAGPDVCIRLACKNTSGIYLCNDNAIPISPTCSYLASYATDITNACTDTPQQTYAVSGQEFDTDSYNIVVAYCNGNDPTDVRPDQYTPPGPNGVGATILDPAAHLANPALGIPEGEFK